MLDQIPWNNDKCAAGYENSTGGYFTTSSETTGLRNRQVILMHMGVKSFHACFEMVLGLSLDTAEIRFRRDGMLAAHDTKSNRLGTEDRSHGGVMC